MSKTASERGTATTPAANRAAAVPSIAPFLPLLDQPMKLCRPMASIGPLFKQTEVIQAAKHVG